MAIVPPLMELQTAERLVEYAPQLPQLLQPPPLQLRLQQPPPLQLQQPPPQPQPQLLQAQLQAVILLQVSNKLSLCSFLPLLEKCHFEP